MMKKIEQYLLINNPIIWNLKLVPVALLVIVVQIILYGVGYIMTDNTIEYNSFFNGSYYLIYAGSILTAILIFIFWLIQYNRNNGLKAYYPQSNLSLYIEWLAIVGLCFIICFIPNSLSLGKEKKWKNAMSEQSYKDASKVMMRASALMPSYDYNFELGRQTPLLVGNAAVNRTKFDTKLYTYEEDAETPDNPIEYIGPSLLYYKDNYSYYEDEKRDEVDRVYKWLVEEKRDSIEATLQAFINLHSLYKLKTNIDVDSWMQMIYNPPLYPVNNDNKILGSDYSVTNHVKEKYTQLTKLQNYYNEVGESYEDDSFNRWFILIPFIMALGFSVMVFSARLTNGRSWIFALLSVGVILFAFSLLTGLVALFDYGMASGILISAAWLVLLVLIGFAVTLKVVNGKKKGRSNIYVNIGLWSIPAVVPWIYQIYTHIDNMLSKSYSSFNDDSALTMFIISAVFTIIAMFPIVMLLRKWKALPED